MLPFFISCLNKVLELRSEHIKQKGVRKLVQSQELPHTCPTNRVGLYVFIGINI